MFFKSNEFKLIMTLVVGLIVFLLPRPEGKQFTITGDPGQALVSQISADFTLVPGDVKPGVYTVEAKVPGSKEGTAKALEAHIAAAGLEGAQVGYVDGMPPPAKIFLCVLAVLILLFMIEPIPLEVTAVLIGVSLVLTGLTDAGSAWAPYAHPVVFFVMCCLIFAIALDKVGLTKRLGFFIIKRAGNSVVKFTFIISIGLGIASGVLHDAAATAIGIVTMLPLMRAVGIEPHTNTAKFMMLSLPFACSTGGMGTLIGGGRNMVSAAFLKEYTGIDISFLDWIIYCLPVALILVPASVLVVYLVYRPDPSFKLPDFDEDMGPMSQEEKVTLAIVGASFLLWLTKGFHGFDYSVTGFLGVAGLVIFKVLKWRDINDNMEWGTALFIFGGGISLGLAMGYSGAGTYFANLLFPLVQGKGWLVLFVGMGVFGAIVTNAMANTAAAALILPIVIPMALREGVDPTILALGLGMATSFALLLVIGCPPNAISYSYRYFKAADLTKVGLVATPIMLTLLTLLCSIWWKIIGLV